MGLDVVAIERCMVGVAIAESGRCTVGLVVAEGASQCQCVHEHKGIEPRCVSGPQAQQEMRQRLLGQGVLGQGQWFHCLFHLMQALG